MSYYNNRYSRNKRSGFYIWYKFKYNDDSSEMYFSYNVPFDDYMKGLRAYFDVYDVELNGTDNHVYQVLDSLGAIENLEGDDYFTEYLTDKCKKDAFEEFKEEYEWEHENEEY